MELPQAPATEIWALRCIFLSEVRVRLSVRVIEFPPYNSVLRS